MSNLKNIIGGVVVIGILFCIGDLYKKVEEIQEERKEEEKTLDNSIAFFPQDII